MADTETAEPAGIARHAGGASLPLSSVVPADAGQPVLDLPPMVDFDGFDAPAAAPEEPPAPSSPATSLSALPNQRPVRQRFLAPIAAAASPAPGGSLPSSRELRPRPAVRPPPAEPRRASADATSALPTPTPSRPRRTWRRNLAVGAAVAATLALAVGLEIGVRPGWLHHLQTTLAESFMPSPGLPKAGKPPADPAQRVAYYAGRAKGGDVDAQFELGVLYAKGEGVPQDYAAAAKWFRTAAEHGMPRAQYDLGVLYERGRGMTLDYSEAAAWYRKAAEHDYALAQYNLAVAYTKGQGVARDAAEAASWYKRAATQGVVAAMVNLAILYERGEGVTMSTVDAYAWYRAAARRGSQPADRRAGELLKAFSAADQSRAETKTAEIAAVVHDAAGEDARISAQAAPSPPSNVPAPVLKSGIVSAAPPPVAAPPAENP